MTTGWREYQAWAGNIPHMEGGPAYTTQSPAPHMAQAWIYPWSHSAQSFLAQAIRSGSVNGIGYDPGAGLDPYGPDREELLRSIAVNYRIEWE